MKIAICDDDKNFLDKFSQKVERTLSEKLGEICEFYTFFNANDIYSNEKLIITTDIFFLDIEMPGIDGTMLSKKIRSINKNALLIYVTNRDEVVYESLEYVLFGFVRKTHMEDLEKVLLRIEEHYKNHTISFELLEKGKSTQVVASCIYYVQLNKDSLEVHTFEDVLRIKGVLKKYAEEFENNKFIQISRYTYVNAIHIQRIDSDKVILDNKTELTVSRKYCKDLKSKYMKVTR